MPIGTRGLDEFPIVVDLPHSGTIVPERIQKKMLSDSILTNVDWFLQDLYDFIPQNGITTLENNLHRYLADPNRDINKTKLTGDYRDEVVYSLTTFDKFIYIMSLNNGINKFRCFFDRLVYQKDHLSKLSIHRNFDMV